MSGMGRSEDSDEGARADVDQRRAGRRPGAAEEAAVPGKDPDFRGPVRQGAVELAPVGGVAKEGFPHVPVDDHRADRHAKLHHHGQDGNVLRQGEARVDRVRGAPRRGEPVLGSRRRGEGEREQRVTREHPQRLAELLVRGQSAATVVVVIHRRQVVMHQRGDVDQFQNDG